MLGLQILGRAGFAIPLLRNIIGICNALLYNRITNSTVQDVGIANPNRQWCIPALVAVAILVYFVRIIAKH
jgi:hypothetical protein